MTGQFSVCQFFKDGTYEYVRRWVDAEEAVHAATHYCSSVAARMGLVARIIVTDGGDCVAFEWTAENGVVFPPIGEAENENSFNTKTT